MLKFQGSEATMSLKKILALGIGLLVAWLLGISLLRQNLGSNVNFFNDDYDRSDYALRGEYILNGQVPYRDSFSEYPQIPTYLFAVPYLLQPRQLGPAVSYTLFSATFSLMMLVVLFATIVLLYRMLPEKKNLAFLLLLPASLYFTYNRFDVLPGFLVLLALFFIQRKQAVLAGCVLALATLTKWYPALLLPAVLSYTYAVTRRFDWKLVLAFCLACLLIVLPTFILGGGGAVLQPYVFHANRDVESVSLAALLQAVLLDGFHLVLPASIVIGLFLVLSILPAPISLFVQIDTFEKLVGWTILIVGIFMFFSRIYSPQWILWLMPLLILSIRSRADAIWIICYDLVTYLGFPVVFGLVVRDPADQSSGWLRAVACLGLILLARMLVVAFRRADVRLSPALAGLRRSPSKKTA